VVAVQPEEPVPGESPQAEAVSAEAVQAEPGVAGIIMVRVIGGQHIPVGTPVSLQARGPVIAWEC
jgi:hypothetical protein